MNDARLPDRWLSERLDQLSSFIDYRGKTPKKKPEGLPLITAKNIRDGYIKRDPREYIAIEDYDEWMTRGIPREGDVVITTEAPMGNAALLNIAGKFAIAQRVICMQFYIKAMGRYAHYALRSPEFQKTLTSNSTGTTVSGIKAATLKGLLIPVPSLAEQKVIADKLDTLLPQVESTKARLERIPQILKRFRQSVLAAAVSGRLIETAHFSTWKRVTVGQVASDIRYGTSKKCSESTGSKPVLRIPNIGDGYILQNNLKFADFEEKERAKLALKQGDLLLIRSNGSLDLVGKTALVRETDSGLLYAGYLIRLRLDDQVADPAYVSLCLRSPKTRAVIEEKARSTSGVNNINSKELASLELSLPSKAAQHEIVRRVDQLFAHADCIEQQVNNALARVNNLTQSILAKAFRGELTEQWRKDNPELISGENSADALLEQIKAERKTIKPKRQKQKA